jgi:TonB-linked SusC/RagA family outer membrane protein
MENRCKFLVIPLKANLFSNIRTVLRITLVLLLFIISGLIGSGNYALAQQLAVSGTVTDQKGQPIAGVTVLVKGTTNGALSNESGKYSLTNVAPDATLSFSFVGMSTQEIPLTGRNIVNATMAEAAIGLDEIIVVAYGSQSKRTLSGAVSNIGSEAIVRTSSTNATGALVGKVQGITARSADSRPGRGTTLQVRNMGSPLFVIDGIPYGGNTGMTSFGFSQGSGQDVFNNLAIEDIESVTILKDASAAIYGLRAANGVVLVTTKAGKNNEAPKINVNGYYGIQNFTRFPKPATGPQFVLGLLQSEQNNGSNPALLYTPEQYAKFVEGTEYGYKSYDYYDMVVRKNVPQSFINASASGGSQKSSYYFSISDISQDAMLKDFTYRRTNIQANLEAGLARGLKVGTRMNALLSKTHNVGVPGLDDYWNPFYSIFNMWPIESPYANDNPAYINQTHNVNVNPATYKDDVTGWVDEYWRTFNVNLYAQYDFKFGLTAKATASYNFSNEDFDGFEYTWAAYKYNAATQIYETSPGYGNQNPWRERHKRNVVSRFAQIQLNYNKTFGDHTVSAVAAYERSDMENAYFVVHTVPTNNWVSLMSFSEQDILSDEWRVEARAGYIARFNYSYKQKYLAEALARYDGSYLYRKDKRWGFFPAVSLGWRISEENFFKDNLGNIFNDFKIRASYGETGSESGVNAWDYLPGYNFFNGSSVLDGAYVIGLIPKGLPITNLSWVKNRSKNIGIDFTILDGKITGQFDIFERKRTGLPASRYDVLLPSEVGYTLPNTNLNADAQRGVEGIITYSSKAGNVTYAIGVNATLARSRNLYTYKPRFGNSWDQYRNSSEDRWASVNWGYKVIGRFQTKDEIAGYLINNDGQGNRTQLPGDFIYQDTNGDKIINTMDQVPIGYAEGANPYMSFGLNGNIGWKGVTLSFDFAGATMQSYRRQYEGQIPYQSNGSGPWYLLADVWHQADVYDATSPWVEGTYPAIRKNSTSHINFQKNSFWVTNVNYLRMKNIELGYNLPKAILTKLGGISNLRIYVNASNMFSFDNMRKFEIDPEVSSTSALVYPQPKLVNTGFNLTF